MEKKNCGFDQLQNRSSSLFAVIQFLNSSFSVSQVLIFNNVSHDKKISNNNYDTMISINCAAVENEVADNRFERAELDWLIFNDPKAYADLIMNGEPEKYLKAITVYRPFEN